MIDINILNLTVISAANYASTLLFGASSIALAGNSCTHVIRLVDNSIAATTLGVPNLDILYAVDGSTGLNADTGKIAFEQSRSGYLVLITDIGAKGYRVRN